MSETTPKRIATADDVRKVGNTVALVATIVPVLLAGIAFWREERANSWRQKEAETLRAGQVRLESKADTAAKKASVAATEAAQVKTKVSRIESALEGSAD